MEKDFVEKRKYPRFDFRMPMRYRRVETDSQEFKGSLIKNISKGGIRMTIYEFLPLNLRLVIEIPLAVGVESVKGTCRVAWVKKVAFNERYEVGVEFANLNQGNDTQISEFIFNKSGEKAL